MLKLMRHFLTFYIKAWEKYGNQNTYFQFDINSKSRSRTFYIPHFERL